MSLLDIYLKFGVCYSSINIYFNFINCSSNFGKPLKQRNSSINVQKYGQKLITLLLMMQVPLSLMMISNKKLGSIVTSTYCHFRCVGLPWKTAIYQKVELLLLKRKLCDRDRKIYPKKWTRRERIWKNIIIEFLRSWNRLQSSSKIDASAK